MKPHIVEEKSRKPVLLSVGVHAVLLLFFTFGALFIPKGEVLKLGMGPGGGQGDFLSVGLAADLGGGAGMYKAPITPRPEAAPPQEETSRRSIPETEPEPEQPVFEKQTSKIIPAPSTAKKVPTTPRLPPNEQAETARPGQIPRESDPGKGPAGGGGGSGGGFGGGQGVSIGSGTGEGNVNSWYIRQVEQRVGQNWLLTSLGENIQVQAVASFVVTSSGRITDIEIEKESGIRSVDLAVMRAIQASTPLPPLPGEFRGKSVRFQAVFEYPPK
ncbi:MAG: TonB family protein [Acidobacteriota bacterium]